MSAHPVPLCPDRRTARLEELLQERCHVAQRLAELDRDIPLLQLELARDSARGAVASEEWLTAREVADALHVSESHVRNLGRRGLIGEHRFGERVRYLGAAVRRYSHREVDA